MIRTTASTSAFVRPVCGAVCGLAVAGDRTASPVASVRRTFLATRSARSSTSRCLSDAGNKSNSASFRTRGSSWASLRLRVWSAACTSEPQLRLCFTGSTACGQCLQHIFQEQLIPGASLHVSPFTAVQSVKSCGMRTHFFNESANIKSRDHSTNKYVKNCNEHGPLHFGGSTGFILWDACNAAHCRKTLRKSRSDAFG